MKIEAIRKFTEIYFNGLKNIPHYQPNCALIFSGKCPPVNEEITVFKVHQITDIINDEWEIKSDVVFLHQGSSLYVITSITTNYEGTVEFPDFPDSNRPCVSLTADEITIKYQIKKESGSILGEEKERMIPRSKWIVVDLLIEIIRPPKDSEPKEFWQSLVGHKFPVDIYEMYKISPRKTEDGTCEIPTKDIAPVLISAGKIAEADFCRKQGNYLSFPAGCFRLQ